MKKRKVDPVIAALSFLLVFLSTQVWHYPEITLEYKLLINAFSLMIVITVLASQYLIHKIVYPKD